MHTKNYPTVLFSQELGGKEQLENNLNCFSPTSGVFWGKIWSDFVSSNAESLFGNSVLERIGYICHGNKTALNSIEIFQFLRPISLQLQLVFILCALLSFSTISVFVYRR